MKVTKILATVVAAGVAIVALTATSESRAGGDEDLVTVKCTGGAVTVSSNQGWHINAAAPWSWKDASGKALGTFVKPASNEATSTTFSGGTSCGGTVKAFVCNGDKCKGPIAIAVK